MQFTDHLADLSGSLVNGVLVQEEVLVPAGSEDWSHI